MPSLAEKKQVRALISSLMKSALTLNLPSESSANLPRILAGAG